MHREHRGSESEASWPGEMALSGHAGQFDRVILEYIQIKPMGHEACTSDKPVHLPGLGHL